MKQSCLIQFFSLVVCAILSSCNVSNISITPTPSYTATPLSTATPIYTKTPHPSATPILTAIPRSLSTPITDYKKVEYSHCKISVEIPMDYEHKMGDGGLEIYSPLYQDIPAFYGILKCREKVMAGFDQIYEDELFVTSMFNKELEAEGRELIKSSPLPPLTPLTTEKGAKLFYFAHTINPAEDYGSTVLDRLWKFTIVGVLPGSPETVVDLIFATDIYMNEESLLHIVRSIAPTN